MQQPNPAAAVVPQELYINRELSWIAFNQRVLAQALDPRVPLLEQAKFSAIFSNNLDEFFMVRVASLKSQQEAGVDIRSDDGLTPLEQLETIQKELRPLLESQQQHYRQSLKRQLAEHGIYLLDYLKLNKRQKEWLSVYFRTEIFPVLTPLAVDPAHPFPFMSNLSLNVAALIRDPESGQRQFARVKVPQKILPRFVPLPNNLCDRHPTPVFTAVPLEQVVAFNLELLFPGMTIEGHYFFRITRDADLELRDLEADDLMEALQEGLRKRRLGGEVVRLEVANEMPEEMVRLLMEGTDVEPEDLYRINGPLGLDDLMHLLSIPLPALKDTPYKGRTSPPLMRAQTTLLEDGSIKAEEFQSIFSVIRRGDVLLHHPFDLFATSVEEFLNQAAEDASVLAIKMTLYRTSKDSAVIAALIRAAENGKQVLALVELFNYLTGFSKQQSFRKLLVAPVTLRKGMETLIRREIDHAKAGRGGHIRAKMNAMVDPAIIALLYEASQAGVVIELVIRGMCCLKPGLAGISETIRVVSVIGRFLEHSRLFWFGNGGQAEVFIGSADWMPRNLDRRVEAVTPIEEAHLMKELEGLLDLYLNDSDAWHMQADGTYVRQPSESKPTLVQTTLMKRWRGGLTTVGAAPAE